MIINLTRVRLITRRLLAPAAMAAFLFASPIALAQPGQTKTDSAQARDDIAFAKSLSRAFKNVAKKVEPSVVHITQFNRVQQFRSDFFGRAIPTGRSQPVQTGLGSGVIVSADGYILTNNHVIANAETLEVGFSDGTKAPAKVIGRDEVTDVAVIKVETSNLQPAEFADSDSIDVGEWVVAVGSPFGFNNTVTAGIVSAKGRSLSPDSANKYEDFIQTDAAINPGNSGGPLLNLEGRIIGINTAIASRTGGSEGLGFAIPSDMARAVMDGIIKNGRVLRGALGIDFSETRAGTESAARVNTVLEGGPADRAGVKSGDIIKKFQGRDVSEARLRTAISVTPPGTRVTLDVLRDGQPKQVAVTVGEMNATLGITEIPALGLSVQSVTREMLSRSRLKGVTGGAVVRNVIAGGRCETLQPGDLIVGALRPNDDTRLTIDTAKDLVDIAEGTRFNQGVRLFVIRNGQGRYLDVVD